MLLYPAGQRRRCCDLPLYLALKQSSGHSSSQAIPTSPLSLGISRKGRNKRARKGIRDLPGCRDNFMSVRAIQGKRLKIKEMLEQTAGPAMLFAPTQLLEEN